jgi:tRNA threonylcarbamoyladenosine biosynthesis protein TsaB
VSDGFWDTSSFSGAIAALEWDEAKKTQPVLKAELTLNVSATHSERLLWGIDTILSAAQWKKEEIDLIGVGVGPGSFTGLRIGVTTARTMADALGVPLVGISSLAALVRPVALHLKDRNERTIIVACTDAAKGELFTLVGAARSVIDCAAMNEGDLPGVWKRGVEEKVQTASQLINIVKRRLIEGLEPDNNRYILMGEGLSIYPEIEKQLPKNKRIDLDLPYLNQITGRYLGILTWECHQLGAVRSPLQVHPRYLRESDAERKLKNN